MSTSLSSKRIVIVQAGDISEPFTITALNPLYEQLQLCSVEASFPQEDLFSFIGRTAFFGVIFERTYSLFDTQRRESDFLDEVATRNALGFIYLVPSQTPPYPPGSLGELSVGLILKEEYHLRGLAGEALELVLDQAFTTMNCHRVQAALLDSPLKDRVMRLFMSRQFLHEGRRRRSFFSLIEQQWRDTTCLALLDTDWLIRTSRLTTVLPRTLWDEMLWRHERERDQLLRWEQEQAEPFGGIPKWLKRTSSMETVRVNVNYLTDSSDTSPSDAEGARPEDQSDSEAGQSDFELLSRRDGLRRRKGKRAATDAHLDTFPYSSESEQEAEFPPFKSRRVYLDDGNEGPSRSQSEAPSFATAPSRSPSLSPAPTSSDEFEADSNAWRSPRPLSRSSTVSSTSNLSEGYTSSAAESPWEMLSDAGSIHAISEREDSPVDPFLERSVENSHLHDGDSEQYWGKAL
ncbi:hypothetical protein GYMLUDRAFT_34698 [Collybiopsis luxurians FD-317 M1]|nr:hypothetical protein GYMLUDRAFT_34698 [Collybiopsis luxurians FD-317 M1]